MRLALFAVVAFFSAMIGVPGAAQAQLAVSRSPAAAPTLGNTTRPSTATTFQISTAGVVTRLSGDAVRLSNTSVTTPTITVSCGIIGICLRNLRVVVTPVTSSGTASIVRLRASSFSGATMTSGTTEGATLDFTLGQMLLSHITFKLGMDVRLAAGATGPQTFDYHVSVT